MTLGPDEANLLKVIMRQFSNWPRITNTIFLLRMNIPDNILNWPSLVRTLLNFAIIQVLDGETFMTKSMYLMSEIYIYSSMHSLSSRRRMLVRLQYPKSMSWR